MYLLLISDLQSGEAHSLLSIALFLSNLDNVTMFSYSLISFIVIPHLQPPSFMLPRKCYPFSFEVPWLLLGSAE
jgi:hypothetical protein